MALDFIRGLFKSPQKCEIRYTPRMAWATARLRELTDLRTDTAVIRRSLQVYESALVGHKKRATLLAARSGRRPFPVHLTSPATLVYLPAEANTGETKTRVMVIDWKTSKRLQELVILAQCDSASALVENALFLYYDLVQRELRGEVILVREPETSTLKQITLFDPIERDDETDLS